MTLRQGLSVAATPDTAEPARQRLPVRQRYYGTSRILRRAHNANLARLSRPLVQKIARAAQTHTLHHRQAVLPPRIVRVKMGLA